MDFQEGFSYYVGYLLMRNLFYVSLCVYLELASFAISPFLASFKQGQRIPRDNAPTPVTSW